MWRDHRFSGRNKTPEITVGVEVGGDRQGGWEKFEKGGVGNIGGLHKIGG